MVANRNVKINDWHQKTKPQSMIDHLHNICWGCFHFTDRRFIFPFRCSNNNRQKKKRKLFNSKQNIFFFFAQLNPKQKKNLPNILLSFHLKFVFLAVFVNKSKAIVIANVWCWLEITLNPNHERDKTCFFVRKLRKAIKVHWILLLNLVKKTSSDFSFD